MTKCFKCGRPARYVWQICSDGKDRPVCRDCDLELNKLGLKWAWPKTWKTKYEAYRRKVLAAAE